ncbi:unnamed protein product [Adineta ricciae]|uniref:Ashwin n=1 Tax=Adineta ricciae TaxID=249248 RepID=A0A815KK05_ADIRI|nr:unnamed protein product [Adineta ricciae]
MNIDLTHPEILTIEQLRTQLSKVVGFDLPDSKYELIPLFYKYVAPLPQRKFRTNRLGTILTSIQRRCGSEKRPLVVESESTDKVCVIKRPAPSVDESEDQVHGEKHESDRGIYTVTIQKSGNQGTAPIKLKRPPPILTTDNEQDATKRVKVDDTTT